MQVELLLERFTHTRRQTEALTAPLSAEDCQLQASPETSPTKWHLAHTSWFFEEFILGPAGVDRVFDATRTMLFNSYYETASTGFWARPARGLLSRPSLAEVMALRERISANVVAFFRESPADAEALRRLEIGIHHEEQHQELILTDILYNLAVNPSEPAYDAASPPPTPPRETSRWQHVSGGRRWLGSEGRAFCFDNETPRHEVLLRDFVIATEPVSNDEFLQFIEDGGYARPELWLSDGWAKAKSEDWRSPLYWRQDARGWRTMSLHGALPLDGVAPARHLSFYEAHAYATWKGARLPTEAEWEAAAPTLRYGEVWEWTQSAYSPYPGFRPPPGALGEYNAKFMCNQIVLRGGSCATPPGHARVTYRNFFPPEARWQFSGARLANDA